MIRVTFTLDEDTVATLRRTADRLGRPQSGVVREAIKEYAHRADKLGEEERRRLLDVFDAVVRHIPDRPAAEADAEIRAVRAARRRPGRRQPRKPLQDAFQHPAR